MKQNTTQCYIEKDGCWLMLHRVKEANDPNEGKWLGVGGHFEAGETADECMRREALEETGLTLESLRYRGIVHFISDQWEDEDVHVFTCDAFHGDLVECDEGDLYWIPKTEISTLPMWEGDKVFLDILLRDGEEFEFTLQYKGDKLIDVIRHR